ncbi:MAG: glycosyltransferase family 2 protein [Clostridia bacterium]|nr:glycosyltransferase family 2 protein [Clostridia bacterium]
MEKVDILLATYNGVEYIREQIDSILNQTHAEFRLLISDDGSIDGTREVLNEYKQKDNRIEVFMQEKNLGVVKNFEFLLEKVKAKYYMFSDQDDIWKETKIEKSLKKIEEGFDLVYSDLEVVDENLNVTYKSYWKLKGIYNKIKKYNNFNALYLNNFVTGCTLISRKELIKSFMPLPNTSKFVLHDYWISLIISQNGKIAYVEEPLIKYRQHKNNKVGSKKKSDELKSIDEIRGLFIQVKKEHFKVFIENEDKFKSEEVKKLNRKALEYYEMLETKKNINFKGWSLFFKLYKYEGFSYNLQNFAILNLPCMAKILYKFKK